ncbi:YitT family protein [Rossellomorea marisflavi]|uniref:YitT family protein n=1 Tax=Rossellomorea marisflavi TaxID=189381 RepID=UPI00064EB9E7|nr:YitT family protein [Rossellomorea marisflavi]KML34599.1 membrane protein [Rossellomorea marisflavi]USK92721.1 YitT family protein [Rossellomorea marisflavi]
MRQKISSFLMMNVGALLVAVNVHFFLSPNDLATGGVSGLSIIMNHVFPGMSLGLFMILINLVLFVVGLIFLGFSFGAKTVYASFALSFYVWLLETVAPIHAPLSNDVLIQLIIGQCIAAIGMAIVFHQDASTGGTDIIAMILNKYFNIEVGRGVLLSDLTIALSSAILFGPQVGMYAFFGVILNGLVIDYVLSQFNSNKEVVIISRHSSEIKSYIVHELGKGATVHTATGAFTSDEKEVITTILGRKDYSRLKGFITKTDNKAFITAHTMNEILGQNFKRLA